MALALSSSLSEDLLRHLCALGALRVGRRRLRKKRDPEVESSGSHQGEAVRETG